MAKKKKKPLTRVEKARKRMGIMFLIALVTILIPLIMLAIRLGTPGKAFN